MSEALIFQFLLGFYKHLKLKDFTISYVVFQFLLGFYAKRISKGSLGYYVFQFLLGFYFGWADDRENRCNTLSIPFGILLVARGVCVRHSPLGAFNSFWDSTYISVGAQTRRPYKVLSIPFGILLHPALAGAKRRGEAFQFLLGFYCFYMCTCISLRIVYLSIPFGILRGMTPFPYLRVQINFQFLLGFYPSPSQPRGSPRGSFQFLLGFYKTNPQLYIGRV